MSSRPDPGLEQSFQAALQAAEKSPASDDAWDHLEELVDSLQRPEDVAELYRKMLGAGLEKSIHDHLAERAVQFHEEWFGDNPSAIARLLSEILDHDAEAHWAFDRITVILTAAERWDELLAAYDRALAVTRDGARSRQLLADAAQVARDFAGNPDRAADYMVELLASDPDNLKLETSLARLLERQERWADLIEIYRSKLGRLAPVEARQLRVEIAGYYLDRLRKPDLALGELATVVEEAVGHPEACAELERILVLEGADTATRREALNLLRTNFDAIQRPRDVIAALEKAVSFTEGAELRALHRELGSRLSILGEDTAAMGHYGILLRLDPSDGDARKQLRQLAQRGDGHELLVEALVAAADAASDGGLQVGLLLEAAHLQRDVLGDAEVAINLYRRVVETPDAELTAALTAAHLLNELLSVAGRREERLAVLEGLAKLERVTVIRQAVLGEAARLAAELGELDRALGAWERRLALDESDLEALNEVIELLAKAERWPALTDALRRRADGPVSGQQRRADLVRIARVQSKELGDLTAAIDTWMTVREQFGEDPEVVAALDEVMAAAGRHGDLAVLIEGAASRERREAGGLLTRVADINRRELARPEHAVELYAQALRVDPGNEGARRGIRELLQAPRCVKAATHALVVAYRETDDWQEILALLEPRLSAQDSARERAALLREAAELHEQRAGDVASAHAALVRALPLDPYDLSLESDFLRLTEASARWLEAADALKAAVDEASDTPARAAQLSHAEGELRELQLDDPPRAADAFGRAAELDPRRLEYHADAARCAARAGRWDQAAAAALEAVRYRTNLEGSAIEAIEGLAAAASAHRALAEAFDPIVVSRQDSLRSSLAWALDLRIASWFRAAGELAGAERAARRAVEQRPRSVESLELLAGLQRELKSDGLVDTLLRLDDLRDSDLDGLYEASETALASERPARARATLIRLYRKSARMWARGETASGERTEEHSARWALERLVELHTAANETEQAVRLLLDGATLPFPAALSRALRQRAAEMLAEQGQRDRAIDLYVGVLADRGDDRDVEVGVLQRVAALCEQEGRTTELLGLRFQELALVDDVDRRIELRLEIARLTGVLEARRSRVEVLRDNLKDKPGHDASIAALEALLVERGRLRELTEVLEEQAATLTAAGEQERAAGLWGRVARLSEESLEDPERAIAAHTRAVALAPSAAIFDALARLQLAQGRPEEAALWLEKRLEHAADSERVAIRIKLARAYIAAAMPVDAVAVLEQAFEDAPKNGEVRKLLINLYRERETWDKLADALTQAARHVSDADTVLAYAREAASLYHERLDQPERSVEVLERAVAHADSDRRLKTMLADGYRAAGRNAEARALLESIIEGYGRRRSASRARAHLRLAKVLHALGETEGAIEQLETASRMDAGDVVILQTLAALARDAGQLDRAERAYRTLLINVRRVLQAGKEEPEVGPCEVLFELSRIARARGDDLRADELIESGLEAVGESDAELTRLEGSLRARGDYELLQRVLETRLGQLRGGHQRAELLGQLADLYDKLLDRPRDAFEARLKALEMEPASPLHYDPARDLAARLGDVERYTELLERLLTATRRESDAHVRCELLLRLAEVKEKEQQDYQGASRLLDQAEATGVRKVDVWRAQARVAGASGHTELQMALLEQLVSLGANQAETRADALYRMAEVHLASEETVLDGIEALSRALADSAHYERAGLIIRSACEHLAPREELLELYEEVARRSSDDALLLHFLEHRAKNPGADVRGALDLAREGAALAGELDEWDRAEALMLRAVELSEEAAEGRAAADWALLGLAQRRHDSGDTAGAVKWLSEAIEVAFNNQVLELGRAVAEQAGGPGGDLTLAAKLYERLVEREPTSRATWEPLAQIYRKLGDIDRLERLVDETLDGLSDPAERNALRLELAGAFLSADGRGDDAVRVLNDILLEAPDNDDAQALLAEHLERTGDTEGLLELLRNQLMAAQGREDSAAIKSLSLELVARLRDVDLSEAISVCQSALFVLPEDAALLRTLLDLGASEFDAHERGDLLERLLKVEVEGKVVEQTLRLVALRKSTEDADAALRALQVGYRRMPGDATLHAQLEQAYRERGDFPGLLLLLLDAADAAERPADEVALLRQAAIVQREQLGDPTAAIELLARAAARAPDDARLRVELATTQADAGAHEAAIATLSECLERAASDADRLDLLRRRARVHTQAGDGEAALVDLDAAFAIDRAAVFEELLAGLERLRAAAAARGDRTRERALTVRLSELRASRGEAALARALLVGWLDTSPADTDALRRLWALDRARGHWEGVVETTDRLVRLEEGAAQIDAALALADACKQLGRPEDARDGLEYARDHQPEDPALRERLAAIYEDQGAERELADVLLADARARSEAGAPAGDRQRLDLLRRAGRLLLACGDRADAIPVLEDVLAAAPGDRASVRTLLEALLEEGLRGQAIERLSAQLDGAGQDRDWRLELLLRRAELHSEGGELRASVEDLEAALELDRERVVGRLVDALEALRFEPDEAPRARELTLRLVALEESRGDDVRVRELLSDWLEGHDDDIEVRQRLSALEARAERWEEVANHSERLAALLTGAEQVKAALALDDACARMSAPERARDGLEAVHAAQPESQELRDRLRSLYERAGDDRALAKVLVEDARAQGDAAAKLERLRRAGALYVQSGDSEAAIPVLVEVIALAPDDREVVLTLAEARARSGQLTEAIAALTGLIERQGDAPHLDLLRRRAALYEEAGADSEALADLERAHGQDPAGNAEALEALLESLRDRAHKAGDEARESTFAMRLVELLAGQGRRDEARAQLTVWLDHAPEDLAGLRRLRALEIADERWEEVFELCERLVPLEEGAAQLEVARALVDAARRLDRHTDARDGLEIVRRAQPESAELREELRQIYELQGASQELAAILLDDAHVTEDPAQRLALLRRAGALLSEVGDSQTAIPVLREVYTLDPTDHENVITLLDSYLMSALLEEADALLDDIIASFKKRRTPELALFYHYKARIASARQDRLKELEHLQNAFTCDKDNGQVAAELVDLAEALENWDLATKTLRAIAMMKDECECPITRAEAYYRQGRISKILGDEKRAVFWARRAHTEDPELEAAVALLHDLGADV